MMNNELNLNNLLPKVQAAVREASRLMMDREHLLVKTKGAMTNLCTSADLAVQDFLYQELRKLLPGSGFLGEEENLVDVNHPYVWVVDPIDGTANFARQIPECCISVALRGDDEILLGVVYNPHHDQLFDAVKGSGAHPQIGLLARTGSEIKASHPQIEAEMRTERSERSDAGGPGG